MPRKRQISRTYVYTIETRTLNNEWQPVYENTDKEDCQRLIDETPFGQLRLVERITTRYVIANRDNETVVQGS